MLLLLLFLLMFVSQILEQSCIIECTSRFVFAQELVVLLFPSFLPYELLMHATVAATKKGAARQPQYCSVALDYCSYCLEHRTAWHFTDFNMNIASRIASTRLGPTYLNTHNNANI